MSTKQKTRKANQIRALCAQSQGRYFKVEFIKRTTGEVRSMCARLGVRKNLTGEGMKYDPKKYNLMVVWDAVKRDYRMINLETVRRLRIDGTFYNVA